MKFLYLAVFWYMLGLNTDLKFVMFVGFLILRCLGLCFFMCPSAAVKKSQQTKTHKNQQLFETITKCVTNMFFPLLTRESPTHRMALRHKQVFKVLVKPLLSLQLAA